MFNHCCLDLDVRKNTSFDTKFKFAVIKYGVIFFVFVTGQDVIRERTAHGRQAERTLFIIQGLWGKQQAT